MKTAILKISIMFLIIGLGCQKEQDDQLFWEISPESNNPIIQNVINGLEFKFCLLNQSGNPATVFNQGENFYFFFSVSNSREKLLYYDCSFPSYYLDDFCRVFNPIGQDLGKPFNPQPEITVGSGAFPFPPDSSYIFKAPWLDTNDTLWVSWYSDNIKVTFESSNRLPLPRGKYYTEIKHRFQFGVYNASDLFTDTLYFKINFLIQ